MTFILSVAEWITHLNSGQLYGMRIIIILEWLGVLFFIISFWKYRVKVVGNDLVFGFGVFSQKINIDDIYQTEIVNIRSKSYYNYGIFNKKRDKKTIYSSGGGQALEITVKNRSSIFVLSSENPGQLRDIISNK